MANTRRRAQAHAKRAYYCSCGKIVSGNGGRANHFYLGGDRYAGKREGHREIGREEHFATYRPCASCRGQCTWVDDAWVCASCGDEWYPPDSYRQYDAPSETF